jgi:hypothetical protein
MNIYLSNRLAISYILIVSIISIIYIYLVSRLITIIIINMCGCYPALSVYISDAHIRLIGAISD